MKNDDFSVLLYSNVTLLMVSPVSVLVETGTLGVFIEIYEKLDLSIDGPFSVLDLIA